MKYYTSMNTFNPGDTLWLSMDSPDFLDNV